MSGSNRCFLNFIQVSQEARWSGIPISLRFSTVWCDPNSESLNIINEAEVDVFLEFSCFFYDPEDVGSVISGSSAFSKSSLSNGSS